MEHFGNFDSIRRSTMDVGVVEKAVARRSDGAIPLPSGLLPLLSPIDFKHPSGLCTGEIGISRLCEGVAFRLPMQYPAGVGSLGDPQAPPITE